MKLLSLIKLISLSALGDHRGELVALERHRTVPFDIQRVYYIFGTKVGVSRGFHAHRSLQQLIVCVKGRCRMLLDDGQRRNEVWLDSPTKGLLVGGFVWREMHDFSADCVLLVLASECYDEGDYIRDFHEFKRLVCP